MATIRIPSINSSFRLVAIHLDHRDGSAGTKKREKEAQDVVSVIPRDSLPLVLCGDMNARLGTHHIFKTQLCLRDSHEGTSRKTSTAYGMLLDYIFVSRDFFVSDQIAPDEKGFPNMKPRKVRDRWGSGEAYAPSDHYPVVCSLQLKTTTALKKQENESNQQWVTHQRKDGVRGTLLRKAMTTEHKLYIENASTHEVMNGDLVEVVSHHDNFAWVKTLEGIEGYVQTKHLLFS